MNVFQKLKYLAFAALIGLTACSSGGGDSTPAATKVSGLVKAPNGMVAMFEQNRSILLALTQALIPAAHAVITGLQPVGGATVELIRVDNNGNQVGDVLATTVTSITGEYSLALPAGVSFAGNLVVRITGNGGAEMNAQVVDQSVDINPISQFVLDRFIADGTALDTLPVNEVVALVGRVEEFDLTATGDLSTMLTQLEAEVGQLVDNEIAVINSTPGNGATVAGVWNLVDFSLGMHDSDPDTTSVYFGTFSLNSGLSAISIVDAGSGDISIADGDYEEAFTNFGVDQSGNTSIYHETDIGAGDGSTFPASIDASGALQISFPFEEELQTVSLGDPVSDPEANGPDFGWRWPPGTELVYDTGNGNVKFLLSRSAGVRYETTDTNADGINDAIDPNARSGDEVDLDMTFALKQGSGMSVSSLSGDYGLVTLEVGVHTQPHANANSSVGVLNFDGASLVSAAVDAIQQLEVDSTPATLPAVNLVTTPSLDGGYSFPYQVTDTGRITLDFAGDGSDIAEGFSSDDGALAVFIDIQTMDDGSASPITTSALHSIDILARLGSTAPAVGNSVYRLFPLMLEANTDGSTALATMSKNSTVTFSSDGSSATANVAFKGFARDNAVAEVNAILDEALPPIVFSVDALDANGAISMSANPVTGENIVLDGFVSADGSMLVMRTYGNDDAGSYADLGIIIGIRQ